MSAVFPIDGQFHLQRKIVVAAGQSDSVTLPLVAVFVSRPVFMLMMFIIIGGTGPDPLGHNGIIDIGIIGRTVGIYLLQIPSDRQDLQYQCH